MVSQLNMHTYKCIFIPEFFSHKKKKNLILCIMTIINNENNDMETISLDNLKHTAILLIGDTGEYKQKREGIFMKATSDNCRNAYP